MRLLFVADGRSPIALNWMRAFLGAEHEVHLVSTFACEADPRLASLTFIPAAFSGLKRDAGSRAAGARRNPFWGAAAVGARTALRQWLGPLTLSGAARRLREVIEGVQPDLVHALRIPYEGMLAGRALEPLAHIPLLISVWGNDFTLHARSTPWMASATRRALHRADGLHADCGRDVRLARDWGFPAERPAVTLPGGGGVQADLFYPPADVTRPGPPVIFNPRGFRAYARSDTFFRAIPQVLEHWPQARFVCTGMAGEQRAKGWVQELGIEGSVDLLPTQTRAAMAGLFRRSQVAVSVTTHDGTPNTLLEALACGCFPVAGDLDSLREWITPGENGLLVDPSSPQQLAEAICHALEDDGLRLRAAQINTRLVAERAEYRRVMEQALDFYRQLAG